MSQDLKEIRRQLRAERCPVTVLQSVRERIAQERTHRLYVYAGWAATAILVICALSVPLVQWSREQPPAPTIVGTIEDERRAVRKQAHLALAYFGQTLNRASNHSRETILEVSLPRLRQGLRTATEAISLPNEPKEPNENTSL